MKLAWIEPWSFRFSSWQMREMRRALRHIGVVSDSLRVCVLSVFVGVLTFVVLLIVRQLLPESKDDLPWHRIITLALLCAPIPWLSVGFFYVGAIIPKWIGMSEKGVRILSLFVNIWLPRKWLRSVSLVERDGFRLLLIRFVSKFAIVGKEIMGKENEITVVVPKKVSDDKVAKFLFDVGLAHLWKVPIA